MDELVRERVQKHVDERRKHPRHALPLLVLVVVEKLPKVFIPFQIRLRNADVVWRHVDDDVPLQPSTNTRLVEFDIKRLVLLLSHIDRPLMVFHLVECDQPDRHGYDPVIVFPLIYRRWGDPSKAKAVFTNRKSSDEDHL